LSDDLVVLGLRRAMLAGVVLGCGGTAAELALMGHAGSPVQGIPFGLCALGATGALATGLRPGAGTVWGMRITGALLIAGAAFGIFEHELIPATLRGAGPALAPGILALLGCLALASTWRQLR
jgi:hypothetical protein